MTLQVYGGLLLQMRRNEWRRPVVLAEQPRSEDVSAHCRLCRLSLLPVRLPWRVLPAVLHAPVPVPLVLLVATAGWRLPICGWRLPICPVACDCLMNVGV